MNSNLLLGTISFVIWSSFSTWYYVNNIRQQDEDQPTIEAVEAIGDEMTEEVEVTEEVIDKPEPTPVAIRLETTLYFDLDDRTIKDQNALTPIIDSLKGLESSRQILIAIIGHTCDLGSDSYNMKLGLSRANNVGNYLQVNLNREFMLSTDSNGENDPLKPNTSDQNRADNRRATITIISEP